MTSSIASSSTASAPATSSSATTSSSARIAAARRRRCRRRRRAQASASPSFRRWPRTARCSPPAPSVCDWRKATSKARRACSVAHGASSGNVVGGAKRGTGLGFPTANIPLPRGTALGHGIYAVRVHIGGERHDAAAYLGTRPTYDDGMPVLEVFLFDFDGDLYGQRDRGGVRRLHPRRPQVRFQRGADCPDAGRRRPRPRHPGRRRLTVILGASRPSATQDPGSTRRGRWLDGICDVPSCAASAEAEALGRCGPARDDSPGG